MGSDPDVRDNRSLREAMIRGKRVAWLFGVGPGLYQVVAPVYIVDEDAARTEFVVAVNEDLRDQWRQATHPADQALRREYALQITRRRVHQPVFRGRVLTAYSSQCALCRLRHPELLDAAHILEDSEGGEPVVTNGMAMCAIHHRAFDQNVIGVRPDYVVEVRSDVLDEVDGPTLKYALQGSHGNRLDLPRQRTAWPDEQLLEKRFERFRAAS
jgi:putative restriction endonuclease